MKGDKSALPRSSEANNAEQGTVPVKGLPQEIALRQVFEWDSVQMPRSWEG